MPPEQLTRWFVLTLSAEQAAISRDFDHLDLILNRRDEILLEWDSGSLQFTAKQREDIERAEHRLNVAMLEVKREMGYQITSQRARTVAVAAYRAS